MLIEAEAICECLHADESVHIHKKDKQHTEVPDIVNRARDGGYQSL